MIKYRQSILQVILLLAAAVSCVLIWQTTYNAKNNAHNQNVGIDAFMQDVHAIKFNQLGKVEAEFFSQKMWHYPQGNITLMQLPHFIIFDAEHPPWDITAAHGKSFDGATRVVLWTRVIGQQAQGKTTLATTLATEQLSIYPARKYAETDLDVIAKQPNKTVQSKGMQVDLTKHTIELLTQVRGEYDPSKN